MGVLESTDTNDYYPFGMNHLKTWNSYFAQGSYKSNKYNGKELQETGMYSYGWREYMPDIARWNGIDQLAESYYSHSPYAYVMNNPINLFDPNGMVSQAFIDELLDAPHGTTWTNTGNGFTNNWGGQMDYDGNPTNYNGYSNMVNGVGKKNPNDESDGPHIVVPSIPLVGKKSGWADQFRSHMEKYGNTTLIDSYFDGFLGGAQSSWNYIKGQFYGESYWDGLANTFTLGAYGTVKTINSLIDATRNVPNYTANDYSYAAGYLTEKAAEAIILKEASQINPFAFRGGYGFKIGRVELLYSNPSVGGGTIFSYVSSTNKKFRLDYHGLPSLNRGKTLHFHTNYWGYTNSPHRSVNPFRWGQPIK
ncbi:RHS repeat-associated core domain-containing protein [Chryseobacterium rhizosphaerae]|nr:RHS repeat-associated core domain-containing protein [Chryseobacterium rhizosphaerae]